MSLSAGTRLGPYEIVTPLGAGGMGEVYRARDTKLNREVAIKVLPESLADDRERLARFSREAQVLAALNHPNIAHIHGFEDSTGVAALVMELVEGPTLADRIAKGPIALDEALPIAKQIAEALEAAHEQGIIHRDLKPANIKVRDDGTVKVLDFGLAKAIEPAGVMSANLSMSPTITTPAMTQAGMILGTAAYMSPEQAKGRAADKRTDMWAFGCVLHEMLTGRRAFEGEDVSDTLAFILTRQPDWDALPPATPAAVRRLLRRCLEKDRKRRLADAGDARLEIEEAEAASAGQTTTAAPAPIQSTLWRRAMPLVVVALFAIMITALVVGRSTRQSSPVETPIRFTIPLPEGESLGTGRPFVAISPDATKVVVAENGRLYLRALSETETRPIPGSEIAANEPARELTTPVFSPDGRFVAFTAGPGRIKKIPVGGGTAVTICDRCGNAFGMSWEGDSIWVGAGRGRGGGLIRVSANGGTPERIVGVEDDEVVDGPQLLPGGAVLFTLATGTDDDRWDRAKIVVQNLASSERKVLVDGGSDARYVPTGHLTYARGGVLYAMPFDVRRLAATGSPLAIIEGVRRANVASNSGTAHYDFSRSGALVYVPGSASLARRLVLVDRKGAVEPVRLPEQAYETPRISPDLKQLAVATDDGTNAIVWIHDLSVPGSLRRLTLGRRNRFPIWTADGSRIAYQSEDGGDFAIYWQRADGSGTAERLTKPAEGETHIPNSWSPRGDAFLFTIVKKSIASLWVFSMSDRKAEPFGKVESPGWPNAAFSPDGRWVAYSQSAITDAANRPGAVRTPRGVFVQPFPATGTVYPVAAGALFPLWSRNGTELLYALPSQGGAFAVVSVTTQPTFTFGIPSVVARRELVTPRGGDRSQRNWDIAPDGERHIGIVDARTQGSPQIEVVLHWFDELKERVPLK
jgi:eukaryotic-like serine/threonine-protein kinase